jgi:RNA polymerase sigma factor (sigma-70 family)
MGRADGDVTATTTHQLYERYGRQIYAYCLHQLRSREEAEDAVQTTFLNAFRSLKGGAVTHAEQAWLYKIAQNVCTARRSSSARRLRLETPNDFDVLQETIPAQNRESAVELIGLEDALGRMPENQRRAILLREWQGLSYREISAELELSQAAVEMLIFRARRTLAGALEQPAEEKTLKRKVGRGLSLSSVLAALKSLLTGGAAVKAVALAVAAGTVSVTASAVHHTIIRSHPGAQTLSVAAPVAMSSLSSSATAVATSRPTPLAAQRPFAHTATHAPSEMTSRFNANGAARPAVDESTLPPPSAPAVPHAIPAQAPAQESTPPPAAAPAPTKPSTPPQSSDDSVKKTSPDAGGQPAAQSTPSGTDNSKDKKRKQQDAGGDSSAPQPVVTEPTVTTPVATVATTTSPTTTTPAPPADDHGKHTKDQQPQQPLAATPPPVTTTTTTPAPAPPADDHGNGKDKGKHDVAPTPPQPVAPPVVTTPAPTVPVDTGNGKGKGHSK